MPGIDPGFYQTGIAMADSDFVEGSLGIQSLWQKPTLATLLGGGGGGGLHALSRKFLQMDALRCVFLHSGAIHTLLVCACACTLAT